ncbi:MAG: hypothetical protein WC373_07745 [Smithella sp.]|jgi:hypothetical protein
MFGQITEGVIGIVAGDIERLLQEQQPSIAEIYKKMGTEGLKVTITADFCPSSAGVVTNYTVSFPLEPKPEAVLKQTVKFKHTINEDQAEIFDEAGNQ